MFRSSHLDVFPKIGFLADWGNPRKISANEFPLHYLLKLNFPTGIYHGTIQRF